MAGENLGGPGLAPRRRHVADLELERLDTAECPARNPGEDVDVVTLPERRCEIGTAERDRVEDIALAAKDELRVATGRFANPGDGQTERGDDGLRVADAAWPEPCQVAQQRVVDE